MGNCFQRSSSVVEPKFVNLSDCPELLDLCLCDVSVITSHNSFLPFIQNVSIASADAVVSAMQKGARCIELDVFSGKDHEPVVAHGMVKQGWGNIFATNSLSFADVIKAIAENAFKQTSDPLFICIENNTNGNVITNNIMAKVLKEHFSGLLTNPGNELACRPLKSLLGTVSIFTDNVAGDFADVVAMRWSDVFRNMDCGEKPGETLTPNCLYRIYPKGDFAGMMSRNYDAVPFLNAGYQFVAMNMQTSDKNMQNYLASFNGCRFKKRS